MCSDDHPRISLPDAEHKTGPAGQTKWAFILVRIGLVCFGLLVLLVLLSIVLHCFGYSALAVEVVAVPLKVFVGVIMMGFLVVTVLKTASHLSLIPKTLFLRSRMRLTDLVLIVALLGSAEGLVLDWILNIDPAPAVVLVPLVAIWVLGGAAWGVWASTRLEVENPWRRWGLILLGVSAPLLLPAIAFGAFRSLAPVVIPLSGRPDHELSSPQGLVLGLFVLAIALPLSILLLRLHRSAGKRNKEENASGTGLPPVT